MTSRRRILIVDPDGVDLLTTVYILERAGYQCTAVQQGGQAVLELPGSRYDLMIAEVDMPGNEKLELVELAHHLFPGQPVILYTRNPSLQTAISALQLRTSAYLIKPVNPDLLINQVRYCIAEAEAMYPFLARGGKTSGYQEEANRVDQLTQALEETIQVIESTRRSFKSRELAALRKKLEDLISRGMTG